MTHWDELLIQCRTQLSRFPLEIYEQIGPNTVSALLQMEYSQAANWIDAHGNPIGDPVAGVILASLVGLNGPLILSSCLVDGTAELLTLSRRLDLSVSIVRMTINAAIAFPGITSRVVN